VVFGGCRTTNATNDMVKVVLVAGGGGTLSRTSTSGLLNVPL